MNKSVSRMYSSKNLVDIELEVINKIFSEEYNEYERFLLLINRERILNLVLNDISEYDKKFLRFIRNSLIHGPQFQFKDILDQMYRYDVIGEILYLDFDIRADNNNTELCKVLENSEILLYSQNFDGPITHSTYNKVTVYGLTISINIGKLNNYIKEKIKNGN